MKTVWSLFDGSGFMVKPWAEMGYTCYCFNADAGDHGPYAMRVNHPLIHYVDAWIEPGWMPDESIPKPDIIFSFPPCTLMAHSGAKHARVTDDVAHAVNLARVAEALGNIIGCPWMVENPVGKLSTNWRKPDHYFHPCDYGSFLHGREELFHPKMPAFDGYNKKTCIWSGNGFEMPEKNPAESCGFFWGWKYLGGDSARTKQLRSLTPRGFAIAVLYANHPNLVDGIK